MQTVLTTPYGRVFWTHAFPVKLRRDGRPDMRCRDGKEASQCLDAILSRVARECLDG